MHERIKENMNTELVKASLLSAYKEMPGYYKDESTPAVRLRTTPTAKIAVYYELYFSGFAPCFILSTLQASVQYFMAKIQ